MSSRIGSVLVPAVIVAFVAGTAGCALTSKADLVGTRYFTPEVPRTHLDAAEAPRAASVRTAFEVRLGRVTSGAHLRERIAYRDAAYEMGYYEDRQWTERPEIYVRRALTRTLFEERLFRRVLGGSAPTLDVEVVAFDELHMPAGHAARVGLKLVLYQDREVILDETLTIDRIVTDASGTPRFEDFVAAMAQALDAAVDQVASRIASTIALRAAPLPPAR
jgi:cholesterol transport system auxiliary component